MTALAANTSILELDSAHSMEQERGQAASTTVYQGSLVVIDADGYIAPATTATGLIGAGVATRESDNSGGADGDLNVRFRSGVFKFVKDGTAIPVQADVGNLAYAVDDNTIANTDGTGTRSAVGTIQQVDTDGVWVAIHFVPPPAAA
jgi:hypothetical protein